MGKSKNIQNLADTNREFQEYLATIKSKLELESKSQTVKLGDYIKIYYEENQWTSIRFIAGENVDFMHTSEWSLNRISEVIKGVANALFGGTGETVQGVAVEKTQEVATALAAMANLEAYLVSRVFTILAGVIESFGSSTAVSFKTSYKSEPIGAGLHLFAVMACDSYEADQFPNKERILEYLYAYEIRYSAQEAQAAAQITISTTLSNELAVLAKKFDKLFDKWQKDEITDEQYTSLRATYKQIQAMIQEEYDDLTKSEGSRMVAMAPLHLE